MAKRKTPKGEKIVDLKPKAEKITNEQLVKLQDSIKQVNIIQADIGAIELRKHEALHAISNYQNVLRNLQQEFETQYGTNDINVATGEIKYNSNDTNETDKKDNDREGL